jgi:hypothetical protein
MASKSSWTKSTSPGRWLSCVRGVQGPIALCRKPIPQPFRAADRFTSSYDATAAGFEPTTPNVRPGDRSTLMRDGAPADASGSAPDCYLHRLDVSCFRQGMGSSFECASSRVFGVTHYCGVLQRYH